LEDQLDDEVRACFDMLVDRYRAQGMSAPEACRAARIEFEGTEQIKEQVRDARVGAGVESLLLDLRYAIRTLGRSKGFTAVTVLTLALGFGVNTAIFSVVYAVLLRPLPYTQPEQLALIWSNFQASGPRAPSSGPIVREIQQRSRLLHEVAGIWVGTGTFTGDANPEQVKVASVTTNFLSMLGVKPAVGRVFLPEEKAGGRPAIVISYGLWQRRFGGDPNIAGKGIPFQGANFTILGVMPQDFQLTSRRTRTSRPSSMPMFPFGDLARFPRTLYYIRMLARMKPGVTAAQRRTISTRRRADRANYTEFAAENLKFDVAPLQRDTTREIRPRCTRSSPARARPVDLLRERRESPARTRHGTTQGNRGSRLARRIERPHCSTAPGRRIRAVFVRWRGRRRFGMARTQSSSATPARLSRATRQRRTQRARSRLHGRRCDSIHPAHRPRAQP
jgi:hypothetical protein